jgi:predicted MFS family arabinose efflux permease
VAPWLSRDAGLICVAAGLRAAAVSLTGVLIAIFLAERGFSTAAIGLVLGAGIAASAVGTIVVGLRANAWGQRRTLIALALLTGAGYAAVGIVDSLALLLAVAVIAMVNGMGRDRGPAAALEQAVLPATTSDDRRTWTLAWYNAVIDAGHALGALAVVVPTMLVRAAGVSRTQGQSITFVLCGVAVMMSAAPYVFLRGGINSSANGVRPRQAVVDPQTRRRVRTLTALFAFDSVGGGFLNSALIAYWFFERYGMTEVQLAGLFFAARLLNVVSHLAAAWLARRIGLVNTMVMTHMPSSVLLMLAPAAPTLPIAAALFLAREALVEMDVPTRQSYVMAVVPPSAYTYASGMTNVARNAGWAIGPIIGGSVMHYGSLAAPLFIGGTLKIVYDLALYRSFRHIRPPEEQPATTSRLLSRTIAE